MSTFTKWLEDRRVRAIRTAWHPSGRVGLQIQAAGEWQWIAKWRGDGAMTFNSVERAENHMKRLIPELDLPEPT